MLTEISDTRSAPWPTVTLVVSHFADGSSAVGTGVVVGLNDVMTAAHVVYSGLAGPAVSVDVAPGYSLGSTPFGVHRADSVDLFPIDPDGDRRIAILESAHDVAVLGFDVPLAAATGAMGLDPAFQGGPAIAAGYPAGSGGRLEATAEVAGDWGIGALEISRFEVSQGFSGGPVWHDGELGPQVVGLVSTALSAFDLGNAVYPTVLGWMDENDRLLMQEAPVPLLTFDGTPQPQEGLAAAPTPSLGEDWAWIPPPVLGLADDPLGWA